MYKKKQHCRGGNAASFRGNQLISGSQVIFQFRGNSAESAKAVVTYMGM